METPPAGMADALARLWTKFQPEIEQRVGLLETAVRELESGALSADSREAAHHAAHKLAGTLGMFGLPRGTDLARTAEVFFATDGVVGAPSATVASCVAEIRAVVEGRK